MQRVRIRTEREAPWKLIILHASLCESADRQADTQKCYKYQITHLASEDLLSFLRWDHRSIPERVPLRVGIDRAGRLYGNSNSVTRIMFDKLFILFLHLVMFQNLQIVTSIFGDAGATADLHGSYISTT